MKRLLTNLCCMAALAAPAGALADAGWTAYGSVEELNAPARPYYLVRLAVRKNPTDCRNKSWFYQNHGIPGSSQTFLVLLEALKSGLPARVYVTGSCNLDGYSEISAVSVTR